MLTVFCYETLRRSVGSRTSRKTRRPPGEIEALAPSWRRALCVHGPENAEVLRAQIGPCRDLQPVHRHDLDGQHDNRQCRNEG